MFADDDVVHVDGRVDPASDIEVIETELVIADMQSLEKALPRLEKEAKKNKELKPQHEEALKAQEILNEGKTLFSAKDKLDFSLLRELHLLTTKPFLYVFNADESVLTDEAKVAELRDSVAPADAVFLDAKVEHELLELDEDDRQEMLDSIGQSEPGLHALARTGFHTLGLQTYLTAGPKEARAWTIHKGDTAPAGSRRHPHRLRARLHQGRDRLLRRPRRGRLHECRQVCRQGAHGGQGLHHAGRRRRGVPLQRLVVSGQGRTCRYALRAARAATADNRSATVSP